MFLRRILLCIKIISIEVIISQIRMKGFFVPLLNVRAKSMCFLQGKGIIAPKS